MPTEEKMTINERLRYLGRFTEPPAAAGRIMRLRYVRADRPGDEQPNPGLVAFYCSLDQQSWSTRLA